jgi:hypothetical protein
MKLHPPAGGLMKQLAHFDYQQFITGLKPGATNRKPLAGV